MSEEHRIWISHEVIEHCEKAGQERLEGKLVKRQETGKAPEHAILIPESQYERLKERATI
jgi:hypothetical protein